MSNWTVSKVYLYILALITFSVLLFNFVILTQSIPDYISPSPGWIMDFTSAKNDLFMREHGMWPDLLNPEHVEKMTAFTPEDVENFRKERQAEAIQQTRDMNLRNIIRHGFSFLLLLPVHLYFFKSARKS